MDMDLAKLYGTAPTEDQEKVAQLELFAKLAADQGIDLNEMSSDQIQYLYDSTFNKVAEDEKEDDEEKDEEKEKKAYDEFAAQKEWQDKVAEADTLGRYMAHAYVQELDNIKEASRVGKAFKAVDKHIQGVGKRVAEIGTRTSKGTAGNLHPGTSRALGGAAYAGGAAGAAGAGYGATKAVKHFTKKKEESKEASALDELAAETAVKIAAEAGYDADEAANRLTAVLTLGPAESQKLASAQDFDQAQHLRALELLEAAGYPINW